MEQLEFSIIVGESTNGTVSWEKDLAVAYEIKDKLFLSDKAILVLDIAPRKWKHVNTKRPEQKCS